MNEASSIARDAVRRIKEAIYDVQIGEAEVKAARNDSSTYVVKFDSRAGNAAVVNVHASHSYDQIVQMLKHAHET